MLIMQKAKQNIRSGKNLSEENSKNFVTIMIGRVSFSQARLHNLLY